MYLKGVLFTILFLQILNEAHSISCYICESVDGGNPDCISDPKQKKHEYSCSLPQLPFQQSSLMSDFNTSFKRVEIFDSCIKAIAYDAIGRKVLLRSCAVQHMACDNIKEVVEKYRGRLDTCVTCNTDLCNSSSAINAGIYTLILCIFATIFWFKQ